VVLGIRPEALADRGPAGVTGTPPSLLTMQVALVQPLGDRLNVYLSTSKHDNLIAQVTAESRLRTSDVVPIYFDMNRAVSSPLIRAVVCWP